MLFSMISFIFYQIHSLTFFTGDVQKSDLIRQKCIWKTTLWTRTCANALCMHFLIPELLHSEKLHYPPLIRIIKWRQTFMYSNAFSPINTWAKTELWTCAKFRCILRWFRRCVPGSGTRDWVTSSSSVQS